MERMDLQRAPRYQEEPRREDFLTNNVIHLIAREAFVLLASAFVYACSQSMQAAVSVFVIGTILAIFPQPIYLIGRVSSRVFVGGYRRGILIIRRRPRSRRYVQMNPAPDIAPGRVVQVQVGNQPSANQPLGRGGLAGGSPGRVVRVRPRAPHPQDIADEIEQYQRGIADEIEQHQRGIAEEIEQHQRDIAGWTQRCQPTQTRRVVRVQPRNQPPAYQPLGGTSLAGDSLAGTSLAGTSLAGGSLAGGGLGRVVRVQPRQ